VNELAAFDADSAASNIGGNWELYWAIVDLFIEGWPDVEEMFLDGLGSDNPTALEKAAHRLKGSAGNLGATGVYRRAGDLEQRWAGGDIENAAAEVAELVHGVHMLIEGLREAQSNSAHAA
jgi:two-component system sensor histidine kinase/response regulator